MSRSLTSKRWLDRKNNGVKHHAFMPREDGCTSVYRTLGLKDVRLLRIGRAVAPGTHERVLHGRAVILVRDVTDVNLSLKRGWVPSLHIDIAGWPENEKSEQVLVAEKLASRASLVLAQ